jgi:hypothetical protein
MNAKPDSSQVLAGLKDFQRRTVEYAFERLYGPEATQRFLVADEVGLGKTLVARGLVAKALDHLWNSVPRIDVVYLCSNVDIARQNIRRLSFPGLDAPIEATRLTLLPIDVPSVPGQRVRFIPMTPGTSLDHRSTLGLARERAFLYRLLENDWFAADDPVAQLVLSGMSGEDSFRREIDRISPGQVPAPLREQVLALFAKSGLRERFQGIYQEFAVLSSNQAPLEIRRRRDEWVGKARQELAELCLEDLEPDIIIFDEFQRFAHLMDEESEASKLASKLYMYPEARLLLLSATPYKGLTLHSEQDEGDHQAEFKRLLTFLDKDVATRVEPLLGRYRQQLERIQTEGGRLALAETKLELEAQLRLVMARTEKRARTESGGSLLREMRAAPSELSVGDVRIYLAQQRLADLLGEGEVMEYWKSAPYLLNFMEHYKLKKVLENRAGERALVQAVRELPDAFLNFDALSSYDDIHIPNPRLRALVEDVVDGGMWALLWIPPAMPYYQLEGPAADPRLRSATKRLIFSSWQMVPKSLATLISYEVERRMMRLGRPEAELNHESWQHQGNLLRFQITEGRHAGLPLLLHCYPCLTFAELCDPRELAREGQFSAGEVIAKLAERIGELVQILNLEYAREGNADERWYWLVPLLLDLRRHPGLMKGWWGRRDLAAIWAGQEEQDGGNAWSEHVRHAWELVGKVQSGEERLGKPPENLLEVLALAASAGTANVMLRTFTRAPEVASLHSVALLDHAAQVGRGFLTYYNHAEVTQLVRTLFPGGAYWHSALSYAHAGCLQAVFDEYAHVLREAMGLAGKKAEEVAATLATEIMEVTTLRTATPKVDHITCPAYSRKVRIEKRSMHMRFAMRFGDQQSDDDAAAEARAGKTQTTRKERVRQAFNSPFWPFVLISTSVGQEGLDFHQYCHSIIHWNLPSNPVDLEQREGRIHRYKGHAIRKNVAHALAREALTTPTADPWEAAFQHSAAQRAPGESDMVPYWFYPGPAGIERSVPHLPLSREIHRIAWLRRSLTAYRMVFGQNRQEDLLEFLLRELSAEDLDASLKELQLDLSPSKHPRPVRMSSSM